MTIPPEKQQEISELFNAVSRYFSSTGISQDYYKNPNNEPTDLQKSVDDFQLKKKVQRATLVETFIDDLEEQIGYKENEVEMLKDQLIKLDLKIDQYDTIIQNIDKGIIPLIDEINVAIGSVKTAYDNRVAAGCKSDLYWELSSTLTYIYYTGAGSNLYTINNYICKKNPNVRTDYGYYGAKYYRKPQNQDYGANIVTEILGTISIGSSSLGVVGTSGTFGIQIGDKITDNIDSPTILPSAPLPSIVSFGTTYLVGVSTNFGGSISSGSTIISHTGIGTTGDIKVGDTVQLSGIISPNTTIVGFGTTTTVLSNVWNPSSGGFISTTGITDSLIISSPSIGIATNKTFNVGALVSSPSLNLNSVSISSATNANFTIVRDTQTAPTSFDYTNNPIDPVTVGIMNSNSIGLGHKIVLTNNGSPVGPFQWHEVRGEFDPEPSCGAGLARYYPGNNSWPGISTFTYTAGGIFISSSFSYATEGTIISVGGTIPYAGIAYTGTSSLNPSNSTCTNLTNLITQAEQSRDLIIQNNTPKINSLINSSKALRGLRDKLESQAFAILQGRISANVELNNLKQDLSALQTTDLSSFEPSSYYFNPDTGKTSSSSLGT